MIELSFPLVLACLAAGVLFLAMEVFITPGVGVKGLIGLLLIVAAVIIAFTQHGAVKGSIVLGTAVVVLVAGGWIAKVTVAKRMVLRDSVGDDPALEVELAGLVGKQGSAVSMLRPAGIARFDDLRVDVTAESEFIEAGTPVIVVGIQGNKVLVKRGG